MAINKATLAKEIDGVIEYIYPKTSGDIVVYDETHSVSAMIQKLVNGKVDIEEGMGLSQNSFTNLLKDKLDGIDERATRVLVDDALSDSSINALQNKIATKKFISYDRMLGPSADIAGKADGSVVGNILELYQQNEERKAAEQQLHDDLEGLDINKFLKSLGLAVVDGNLCAIIEEDEPVEA